MSRSPSTTSPSPALLQSPAVTLPLALAPGPTATQPLPGSPVLRAASTIGGDRGSGASLLHLLNSHAPSSISSSATSAAQLSPYAVPFNGLDAPLQGRLDEGGRSSPSPPFSVGIASAAPGVQPLWSDLQGSAGLPASETAPARCINVPTTHLDDPADGRECHTQRSKNRRKETTVPVSGRRSYGGRGSGQRASSHPSAFKTSLRGCCFRCLSSDHFAARCRDPIRCVYCRRSGHTERHCRRRAKLRTQASCSSTSTPPSQPPPPPPSPAMATRGGVASERLFESHSFVVATPVMENMVKSLTTSALVGTLSEKRDVSPDAAARALERELGIPWASVVVTKHSLEDFLIRFDFRNHRRIAMEAGSLLCRGVILSLKPWSPTARDIQRRGRFYCRLAIEGLPQQSWSVDSVQQFVAGKVIIDRLEQQSVDRMNTSACFAWGWAWNPDAIPTSNTFSVIDIFELLGARAALADGVPPVPGRMGPTYPVLIHLDTSKESAGPNGVVLPLVCHPWALGIEDVCSRQPQGPCGGAHKRLLPRKRDDNVDDGDACRKPRGRRSFRSAILGCNAPEGSAQAPARHARGQLLPRGGPAPFQGLLQLPLGRVRVGWADDEAFFEAVGAFGPSAPTAACGFPAVSVDDVARQLQRLELDGGDRDPFLGKLFLQPDPAVLGAPPAGAVLETAAEPKMTTPSRRSARIGALPMGSLIVEQRAHALLAKQLEFIDKVKEHSPRARGRYVDRFKSPLGRKAVSKLARIVGIGSQASIALPDETCRPTWGWRRWAPDCPHLALRRL
ncbi:hypothetical protein ACQ4PT_035844 [Festuca glaucescens]